MAESRQPTYSPLQDSVYTAIEYPAHTNGAAPDISVANRDGTYYIFAQNVLPRGSRVVTREGAELQIGTTVADTYLGGYEWILPNGSAVTVAAFSTGIYYLNTAGNTWSTVIASAFTAVASAAHVDWVPMRTSSSGIRLICVPESPATAAAPEPVRWWTGATTTSFIVLATAVQGNCGISWKSHFLLGDTTDTGDGHIPYRVHWSALGDPTVWSGTASAGSIDLLDGNTSKVLRFLPLRRELVAYKEFGAHAITYKGNPFWFTQSLLSEQINPLGRNAICSVNNGDAHFLFTSDGFLLWDGQSVKYIGKDKVDRSTLSILDWTRQQYISCFYYPPTREVWVSHPCRPGSSITDFKVWVYSLDYDSWWAISGIVPSIGTMLYKTLSSAGSVVMAANRNYGNGLIAGLYSGFNDLTSTGLTSIDCRLSPSPLDFGHQAHKRVKYYAPTLRGTQFVATATAPTVTINADTYEWEHELDSSTAAGATYSYPLSFASPLPQQNVSGHFGSRFLSVGLRWLSTGASVEFAGMVYYAALRGDHRSIKG